MNNLPFQLTCRHDKGGVWYVRIKTSEGYSPRKSTGTRDKSEAIKIALEWYKNGIGKLEKPRDAQVLAYIEKAKRLNFTLDDIKSLMEVLTRRHFVTAYTLSGDNTINAYDYLMDFWTFDKSPYIKNKLRRGQTITQNYCYIARLTIAKYWQDFKDKTLSCITRADLLRKMDELDKTGLSSARKDKIMQQCLLPLRYAFNNDIIACDVTKGVTPYAQNPKERHILTPQIAKALFARTWQNEAVKLANMVAMCTGMRAGEILALRKGDIYDTYIAVRHSYNRIDKLKTPKNGEERTAFLPFPSIIKALRSLADTNRFYNGDNAFVFCSQNENKPIGEALLLKNLHKELKALGVADYQSYTFHAWRHFFATYMKDQIGDKILQQQTGHKTLTMLEHYSSHQTPADIAKLESAQKSIFGDIIGE